MLPKEFQEKNNEYLVSLNQSLQQSLQIAVLRLEKAGLPFQDLILHLRQNNALLPHNGTGDVISVGGPYVHGTLTEAGDLAGAVRFVFECSTDKIEILQFLQGHVWTCAQATEVEYFRNWLLNENEDMIDHPQHWGVEKSDAPPDWFAGA